MSGFGLSAGAAPSEEIFSSRPREMLVVEAACCTVFAASPGCHSLAMELTGTCQSALCLRAFHVHRTLCFVACCG